MTSAISKTQLLEESQAQLSSLVASLAAYINPILEAHFVLGGAVTVDETTLINEVIHAPITATVRQALIDEYTTVEAGWEVEHVFDRDGNYFRFS